MTQSDDLDVNATLLNFKNCASIHKEQFRHPDVTVLITGHHTKNDSTFCHKRADNDPLYRAYCKVHYGAAYFEGMCGEDSVAIITDISQQLFGATSLARQLLTLMGVNSDVLRNNSECYNLETYVSSSGWFNIYNLKYPFLSSCAVQELLPFIDSMSNSSCWKDTPNVTIPLSNLTPDDLPARVDPCSWSNRRTRICTGIKVSADPDEACKMQCCTQSGGQSSKVFYPAGKSCGEDGVCFNNQCFQRT